MTRASYAERLLQLLRWSAMTLRYASRWVNVHRSSAVARRRIVRGCGGSTRIGDCRSVNPFTIVYGCGGAVIGNGVRRAAHVVIPERHNQSTDAVSLNRSRATRRGMRSEDHVWIKARAKMLDGVTIDGQCVIGAGSVASRSGPRHRTALGAPAGIVRLAPQAAVRPGP